MRDMDGRKIDWIRKDLGMSWAELHRELGVTRMTLWRYRTEGAPRLAALAILGLWYSRKMGNLLGTPDASDTKGDSKGSRKRKS